MLEENFCSQIRAENINQLRQNIYFLTEYQCVIVHFGYTQSLQYFLYFCFTRLFIDLNKYYDRANQLL